jgi:LysM repeat protein
MPKNNRLWPYVKFAYAKPGDFVTLTAVQRRHFIQGLCACCGTLGLSKLLGAVHEVQKGETLYSISRACEVSVAELMKANPDVVPSKLKVGQILTVPEKPGEGATKSPSEAPPGPASAPPAPPEPTPSKPQPPEFHTVVKGDTLSSIARTHQLPLAELRQLNPASSDILSIGQQLRIRKATTALVDAGPVQDPPTKTNPGPTTILIPPEAQTPPPPPPPPEKATEKEKGRDKEKNKDDDKEKDKAPAPPKYEFVTGRAKLQIDRPKLGTRDWKFIVTHHSGTSTGNAKIFDYFHRRVRGMENGLAYHFVIGNGSESGDGEIETGERWLKQLQGGHVKSDAQNEVAIGICLVGDFQRDRPTRKQIASLIELVSYLRQKVGRPEPEFFLHRDINIIPTDCPGRYIPAQALYRLLGKGVRPKY